MSQQYTYELLITVNPTVATNEGWPEAFGFSVSGDAPVVISAVEEGGSAQGAGLQTGDVIVELDGENVQQWSRDQVRVHLSGDD